MRRSVAMLVLFLGLMQATGILPPASPGHCRDVCPGDDPEGDCPPFCDDCACCAAPSSSAAIEPGGQRSPASTRASHPIESFASSEPSPREILHIPKSPLS